jgi:copper chaperone NosL
MKRIIPFTLLLALLLAGSADAGQKGPSLPSAQDKCPVCGMFVAKYPDWTASIVYKDGKTLHFDGVKDLVTYYLNPAKYDPDRKRADITAVVVKDYYSLAFIDGKRAFYVIGGNVLGPMGKELVPFAQKADAEGFLRDHRGKRILRFGEITPATVKELQ